MVSHMYLMWGHGYDSFCENDEPWFCDVSKTYAETFASFVSLESQTDTPHSPISYINGFIIRLLMLNVLIAVISNYFMVALEKANITFWVNRLQFITECQSLFSLLCFWNCCRNDSHSHDIEIDDQVSNYDDYSQLEIDEDTRDTLDNHVLDHEEIRRNEKIETLSMCTESSQVEKQQDERIAFGKFNRYLYKKVLRNEDKQRFFSWWFNQSHIERNSAPCFITRLRYFFRFASLNEIMFPAKEFENVIIGIPYNKKGKGFKLIVARCLSYILAAINILLVALSFLLGTVTFGLLWHSKMKKNLFYVETVEMSLNVEKTDQLKKELQITLEDYDRNQDKKLERIMKKQSEKEKKQFDKLFKKQKEYTKKSIEHEIRFDTIDHHLAEIKVLIAAISRK